MNIVEFAYQVIELNEENTRLKAKVAELEKYKKQYDELLTNSMQHSQAMLHNFVALAMTSSEDQIKQSAAFVVEN